MKNLIPFIDNVQIPSFMIKEKPYSAISMAGKYIYSFLREASKLYAIRQELPSYQIIATIKEFEEIFQTSESYLYQTLIELKEFNLIQFAFENNKINITFHQASDGNEKKDKENARFSKESSLKKDLHSLHVPEIIQQSLLKHAERIEKETIDLKDIEDHYCYNKSLLTPEEYASVIDFCLEKTNGHIKQVKAVLTTGVNNKLKHKNQNAAPSLNNKKEPIPKWLNDETSSANNTSERNNQSDDNASTEYYKAQFNRMMEKRDNKAKSN